MPRLARFSKAWPDIVINQIVADEKIDMSGGKSISWCVTGQAMAGAGKPVLFNDFIYSVCSPAYLRNVDPLQSINDLAHHPLFDVHGIAGDHWVD